LPAAKTKCDGFSSGCRPGLFALYGLAHPAVTTVPESLDGIP